MNRALTHAYWYGYGVAFLIMFQRTEEAKDVLLCLLLALTSWSSVIYELIRGSL